MASVPAWLEVISYVKALVEATSLGVDFRRAYQEHRADPAARRAAERASVRYSTYSDEELDAIKERIKDCQNQFIAEGSGKRRGKCLCHVFEDIIAGNGGVLPHVDDWERIYEQMCAHRKGDR